MNTWEQRQTHTCETCKGSGHDKGSTPLVEFRKEEGDDQRRHTTLKQGSGCISCQGKGVVQ